MQISPAPLIRFSSEDFDRRERLDAWRETYGRTILKVEAEPHADQAFRTDNALRALSNIGVGIGFTTAATYRRTRALIDNDDFMFLIHASGAGSASQRGREAFLADGDATLLWGAETGATASPSDLHYIAIQIPHAVLTPLVVDATAAVAQKVQRQSEALSLLVGYVQSIQRINAALSPQISNLAATHITDLIAMALGATRDAREAALGRGVRAARLRAVKEDIAANLTLPSLGIDEVAARQGISERYIRSLFESEDRSFSDYVRVLRLEWAKRRLMIDWAGAHTIAEIALGAGFSGVSHFNHAFRRHFGVTPSNVRSQARQSAEAYSG